MAGVKGQIQSRGVERRKAIVDAAIEVFGRIGYRGSGIGAIAKQVGITPGGILHHFGTKEGLLQAVIIERDSRMSSQVMALRAHGAKTAIAKGLVKDAEVNSQQRELCALYAVLEAENLSPDTPLHDFFVHRSRLVRDFVARTLQDGVDSGELRTDINIGLKAAEIIAFMEGAITVWLLDPETFDLVEVFGSYVDGLLMQLSAPATAPAEPKPGRSSPRQKPA